MQDCNSGAGRGTRVSLFSECLFAGSSCGRNLEPFFFPIKKVRALDPIGFLVNPECLMKILTIRSNELASNQILRWSGMMTLCDLTARPFSYPKGVAPSGRFRDLLHRIVIMEPLRDGAVNLTSFDHLARRVRMIRKLTQKKARTL